MCAGYLGGWETYYGGYLHYGIHDFWHDDHPGADVISEIFYSTNFYTTKAVALIANWTSGTSPAPAPLWIHLAYQGVHGPFQWPPAWEQIGTHPPYHSRVFGSMLGVVDTGLANVTRALRSNGMWANTLLVVTADNGGGCAGEGPAFNFPLRGRKCVVGPHHLLVAVWRVR